jgi:hypothetical protein
VSATAVNVDTVDGQMTIHGKVGTAAEKAKAEQTVRQLDGVKDVKNLLQVVPEDQQKRVDAKDSDIKDHVEASLKAAKTMDDINVASVNKGIVLLSGKTATLGQKLLVIERVYTVAGVRGVSSEIETARENNKLGIGHQKGRPTSSGRPFFLAAWPNSIGVVLWIATDQSISECVRRDYRGVVRF